MRKISKNIPALTTVLVVSLIPLAVFADHNIGHTITQLQERIRELKSQLSALERQSSALTGSLAGQTPEMRFSRDLYFGMANDPDVTKLQEFLKENGYYSGPVTGGFFSLTLKAVRSFQAANGVEPTGYFGPISRQAATKFSSRIAPPTPGATPSLPRAVESNPAPVAAPFLTAPQMPESSTASPAQAAPQPSPVAASPTMTLPTTTPSTSPSPTLQTAPASSITLAADKINGPAPLTVNFTATLYNFPSCGNTYVWDYGEGLVFAVAETCASPITNLAARGMSKQHTYSQPGAYRARLTVNNVVSNEIAITVSPVLTVPQTISAIPPLFSPVVVTSGGHPNHGAPCDKHIFKYFSIPGVTLSNKRAPTQFLGADYDIRNDPWPPDPSVDTGFYRIESNGAKVIHSAPTPNGFEERWTLKHDRTANKANAWMLGYYDCDGNPIGQSSQVWSGEIFDADVNVVGTGQVAQEVSGTFADMYDSGGTRIILMRPFGGGTNIYGFAIYGSSGQYDHFTGVLRIPSLSYLTPESGPVGTVVTVSGFGFTPVNNRLEFDRKAIGYLPSADGKTLSFTVPSQITIGAPCAPDATCPLSPSLPVGPGDHEISVINSSGTSNTLIFTVASSITLAADKINGPAPLTVNFTATLYNFPSCGNTYVWDYGEGLVFAVAETCASPITNLAARGMSKQHTYSQPGAYRARLTVNNVASNEIAIMVAP